MRYIVLLTAVLLLFACGRVVPNSPRVQVTIYNDTGYYMEVDVQGNITSIPVGKWAVVTVNKDGTSDYYFVARWTVPPNKIEQFYADRYEKLRKEYRISE